MASQGQHQTASLYVGDLSAEVTEAILFDLFKAVGPVLSIRVCRDAVTRRSLGYAYVNFQNPVDAERALETLNYHPINGRPLRIMWSHRDPNLRKAATSNVFIKNLHESIDNQTLYDTFSQFGNILSCKVATDQYSRSRGYGFIHFETDESAKAAIEKVNNMLLKDMKVYVGRFVRRSQRLAESLQSYTNLYVKDFKKDIDVAELTSFFNRFGPVRENGIVVKRDARDRPFAFVDFVEHEAAVKAVSEGHDQHFAEVCESEQKLYVQRAQKKAERQEELRKRFSQLKAKRASDAAGSNLYVKNLDETVTEQDLRSVFEKFGEIVSVKIMMDDKDPPQSKGFGFVSFKDGEQANKAISEMSGYILGSKPLYVNLAQRREVRRAHLEIQYAARMGGRMPMANMGAPQGPMGYPPMYQPPYFPPQGFGMFPGGRGGFPGMPPKWAPQGLPFQQRGLPARRPAAPRGSMPPRAAGVVPRGMRPPFGQQQFPKQARGPAALPVPFAQQPIAPPPLVAIPGPAGEQPLTSAALAQMTPGQQKNALGERLFARINFTHPEHAAKITGMLLEMDVTEQLNMLETPEVLQGKIKEALDVLRAHMEMETQME